RQPRPGASTIPLTVFSTPDHTTADTPAFAKPAPTRPPINACELDDGMPKRLVMICHVIAPAKDKESDEIEECRQSYRIVRTQDAGRNNSCDRISGIIHAVEKIECQRDQNQSDQQQKSQRRGIHHCTP